MNASYLRVKNWGRHQHYDPLKRRPPWIKIYNDLLGDDDAFMRLDEETQWQLVRIWLVASRSSALTRDEEGGIVPAVANDTASLQRSIMSVRKVPLEALIRDGWLIPVSESELLTPADLPVEMPGKRRRRASTRASAGASTDASGALRGRAEEVSDVGPNVSGRPFSADARTDEEGLLFKNELLCARLLQRIGDHADKGTRTVLRSLAERASEASLAKVIESLDTHAGEIRDRAAYAVGALRDEVCAREVA